MSPDPFELAPPSAAQGRTWGVAALLLAVADALQARLGAVTVQGELSGFSRASSGHCYFSLKDSDGGAALLRCAMFRRAAGLLGFAPADGQQVELRGRITVYEARGELQCVVEAMQALGAGSLYELFMRLKARLSTEGLFDPARKRALPAYPRVLGAITSPGAAAWHDVLTAVRRRAPHVRVLLYPSLVQGPQAPAELRRALALAVERDEVDTLILCRGGGSLEDLWAFNDEALVRAVAACPIPIVCGVGHEVDVTLAELAADLRAATPTAAAELATPRRDDELARLDGLARRLQRGLRRRLDNQAQRLDRLALHLGRPARLLVRQATGLQGLQARLRWGLVQRLSRERVAVDHSNIALTRAVQARLTQDKERLARLALRLHANDPRQVLQRGYVWLSDDRGTAVTRAAQVKPGQTLRARWVDGQAQLRVESKLPPDLA